MNGSAIDNLVRAGQGAIYEPDVSYIESINTGGFSVVHKARVVIEERH
jgi:hypothetical protein